MKIRELFKYLPADIITGREDLKIRELCYDSRKAQKHDIFVALKGAKSDGHLFIQEVLARGAYAVAEEGSVSPHERVFFVKETRAALALLSKAFFKDPDKALFIAGVTGTNGKTTSTYMIKSILDESGLLTGIIGTIQYVIGDEIIPANNTTPESFEIYRMFRKMADTGCKACAIEVSSHAITMHRVAGIDFDCAIFTNLTQDHLDYHKTMEEYFAAKLRFFDLLKASSKPQKLCIINRDIPQCEQICSYIKELGLHLQLYSLKSEADWTGESRKMNITHNIFNIRHHKNVYKIDTPMLGEFNIYNALCATAAACMLSCSVKNTEKALAKVRVTGRFERVENSLGFAVIVDYAHTPDALENVVKAARALKPARIITVFGAGGDRDRKKRSLMGEISRRLSDYTIITSDNPRSEDPHAIIREIETAFEGCADYEIEADRDMAIKKAIKKATKGDLIILAGKGHENYQIFKDKTVHFSDRETAEKYLKLKK